MRIKAKRFQDHWRGNGVFVALITERASYLLAVRRKWRMDVVEPPSKPHVKRWYLGPFEFERARYRTIK